MSSVAAAKPRSSAKDFVVLAKLGKGAFGTVYKVQRKQDGKVYALKKIAIGKMPRRDLLDTMGEVRLLASISHANIVRFAEAFIIEKSMELCIVQEFADGGDLAMQVEQLSKARRYMAEELIWTYAIQALEGLTHLHSLGILHRDLKPANIMLCLDGTIKLGDLNVSKLAKFSLVKTQIGTPYYMSPEIWNNKPYGDRSDMWALGCVIYELAALKPPFQGRNIDELSRKVQAGYFPRVPAHYSKDLEELISSLLRKNARQRPSASALLKSGLITKKRAELRRWMDETRRAAEDFHESANSNLLGTIAVPARMDARSVAQIQLPSPQYHRPAANSRKSFGGSHGASSDKSAEPAVAAAAAGAPGGDSGLYRPHVHEPPRAGGGGRIPVASDLPKRYEQPGVPGGRSDAWGGAGAARGGGAAAGAGGRGGGVGSVAEARARAREEANRLMADDERRRRGASEPRAAYGGAAYGGAAYGAAAYGARPHADPRLPSLPVPAVGRPSARSRSEDPASARRGFVPSVRPSSRLVGPNGAEYAAYRPSAYAAARAGAYGGPSSRGSARGPPSRGSSRGSRAGFTPRGGAAARGAHGRAYDSCLDLVADAYGVRGAGRARPTKQAPHWDSRLHPAGGGRRGPSSRGGDGGGRLPSRGSVYSDNGSRAGPYAQPRASRGDLPSVRGFGRGAGHEDSSAYGARPRPYAHPSAGSRGYAPEPRGYGAYAAAAPSSRAGAAYAAPSARAGGDYSAGGYAANPSARGHGGYAAGGARRGSNASYASGYGGAYQPSAAGIPSARSGKGSMPSWWG
ncbi:hypothetical protein FNF28_00827 [Cafeteria roenbergensis]|uniref:non-specific serine/threonine protein kinase n=1 Tax=Cafeteria roenbergensis TaxID=33653 RepID=A0A5A8E0M6_CAFRO|nr:hypothetical protein FNF28_00827 [Cafeteria roenbergensis]